MVAGATGIDLVAMVIAADEGVMPQTREHMEICSLLGVEYGLVVLTKVDLVDEEWLELVQEDIGEFTRGTFLEGAPVLPTSAASGQGIEAFMATLEDLCARLPERPPSSLFRLPVDRVFTMRGFGTVITGTLVSGRVRVGDGIMIYPSGISSKVRGIQVHNDAVSEAESGTRTAINFQGLDKAAVNRGDVVSSPGALISSYMIDLSTHFLGSNKKPLKNRTRVRFHAGTSEILGQMILLDRDELLPGDTAVTQIRLEAPTALVRDDRFVIRSYSPVRTIGGGQVLNPIPPKHKRLKPDTIAGLNRIPELAPEDLIAYHADASGYRGLSFGALKIITNLTEKSLEATLQGLLSRKKLVLADRDLRLYIHQNSFDGITREIFDHLDRYHAAYPLKGGMPKEELKSKFPPYMGAKLFSLVLNQAVKNKEVVPEEDTVRLARHAVSLGVDQKQIRQKILALYEQSGLTPPYARELGQLLGVAPGGAKDVLLLLVDEGLILKVKEDLYLRNRPSMPSRRS